MILNKTILGRILAIDYGRKRVGIAATDPLQIIANGLKTVATADIWKFLHDYIKNEDVEQIVVGYPMQMNNKPSEAVAYINPFLKKLTKKYPSLKITQFDERFTSKMAKDAMLQGGLKKKARQNKATVDMVSATIILQSYLESRN